MAGRGGVGKSVVVATWDRETGNVAEKAFKHTGAGIPQEFVEDMTIEEAEVHADDDAAYAGPGARDGMSWRPGVCPKDDPHERGGEFPGHAGQAREGVCHRFDGKRLRRYVDGFAGRHDVRPPDTVDRMWKAVIGMFGKRSRYRGPVADNRPSGGTRACRIS